MNEQLAVVQSARYGKVDSRVGLFITVKLVNKSMSDLYIPDVQEKIEACEYNFTIDELVGKCVKVKVNHDRNFDTVEFVNFFF